MMSTILNLLGTSTILIMTIITTTTTTTTTNTNTNTSWSMSNTCIRRSLSVSVLKHDQGFPVGEELTITDNYVIHRYYYYYYHYYYN